MREELVGVTVADPGNEEAIGLEEGTKEEISIWATLATLARRSEVAVVLLVFATDF